MPALDALKGKWIALSLLALKLGIIAIFVVLPIVDLYQGLADEDDLVSARVSRYERLIARDGDIARASVELNEHLDKAPFLFPKFQGGLNGVQLQQKIASLIRDRKGQSVSVSEIAPKNMGAFTKFGVRIVARIPSDSLSDFLYDMDATQPSLFVEKLEVRGDASANINRGGRPLEPLTVQCDVFGYFVSS